MIRIFVSSCLLGSPVRHDGRHKKSAHPTLQRWLDEGRLISVCPEMLGGLGTPRPPSEMRDGHVFTNGGRDVTNEFEAGARAVLEQAAPDVRIAILKENSPSCGSSFVYDGSFTGARIQGQGVTTAHLRERGIVVFSENEIDEAEAFVNSVMGERE